MLDAYDLMHCGAVLLDACGKVVGLNTRAASLLGDALAVCQDQLSATDRATREAVKTLLCRAREPAHGCGANLVIAVNREQGRPLLIHAARCSAPTGEQARENPIILIILDPCEDGGPSEAVLRQAFGLTSAEARIALGLARGRELKEIAALHCVAESTVRSQLKSILSKTDTHRQSELVALLARFSRGPPAHVMGPEGGHSRLVSAPPRRLGSQSYARPTAFGGHAGPERL